MLYDYFKILIIYIIPQCHGFLFGLIGGEKLDRTVGERGECAHWGSVNPYATPFITETGEIFDRDDYIAAHRTLPIGSYATVTNEDNHRSVVVRITGKGPYSEGRLMELSPTAFNQIADISEAVIPCTVAIKGNPGPTPNLSGTFPRPDYQNQPGYPQANYPNEHGHPQTDYQNKPGHQRPGYQN